MCNCKDRYTIEPHGNGYAIYWARCDHRHGYNLANFVECDMGGLQQLLAVANAEVERLENQSGKETRDSKAG